MYWAIYLLYYIFAWFARIWNSSSVCVEKLYICSSFVCRNFCKIFKWLWQNWALFKCGTTVTVGCIKIITGQYFLVCVLVGFIVLVWFYLQLFLPIAYCHPELLVLPFCIYSNEFPPVVKLFNQKSFTFMTPENYTRAGLVPLLSPFLFCQEKH